MIHTYFEKLYEIQLKKFDDINLPDFGKFISSNGYRENSNIPRL